MPNPAPATALRSGLIETVLARRAQEGITDKMAILNQHLTGNEFRLRVQAIVEPLPACTATSKASPAPRPFPISRR